MTQTSKRNQRNSHYGGPTHYEHDTKAPTNPFDDEDKKSIDSDDHTQLSPMFIDYLRKKTTAPDLEKINPKCDISDKYSGLKVTHKISPVDGKTLGCDRSHTFDTFVDQRRISGDAGQQKRVGHGWQVARTLKRVLSSKGRATRKARHTSALPQGLAA
jgi:hypothetical protein